VDRYSNDANNISQGDSFTEINMILEAADLMTTPRGTEKLTVDRTRAMIKVKNQLSKLIKKK